MLVSVESGDILDIVAWHEFSGVASLSMARHTHQINFRVDEELSKALDAAAQRERRRRGDLARLLFEYAFEQYRAADFSYEALTRRMKTGA
jgi:hypothetical protein